VQTITAIDLCWSGRPLSIASALLRSENYAALIDPGPASTLATLREQLAAHGLNVSDLNAVFLTHIHLDHAGATGALVRENPRLRVYVHTRGVSHMIDPSILLHSAARLYKEEMEQLFGEFLPVPAANLQALEGGEVIAFGSRQIQVLYTPGHASHHVAYFDHTDGIAFVGDTAGISILGHPFILPATPPPDISLELWDASLDAIVGLHPQRLFLTHFSFSDNPAHHIASYRERLHRWRDLTASILALNLDESESLHRFAQEIAAEAAQFLTPDEISQYAFNGALHLSWLGLARYHRKRALAKKPPTSP
jgi:glyoxylase-like metal-dependent hydrolase (beta-lactamase superfamily II)